jgi:hypothetical protein
MISIRSPLTASPCRWKASRSSVPGKPAAAIPLIEKVHLSIARTNIDSNYVLGLCYLDTRRYDDARNTLLGQAYRSLGQTGQASHEFQIAEQLMLTNNA